jgi:hypothetical protein
MHLHLHVIAVALRMATSVASTVMQSFIRVQSQHSSQQAHYNMFVYTVQQQKESGPYRGGTGQQSLSAECYKCCAEERGLPAVQGHKLYNLTTGRSQVHLAMQLWTCKQQTWDGRVPAQGKDLTLNYIAL